ncbi:MAG: UDP-glucose--hexose-1-phosphate uridylyltransferase [Clostridium sp.]|nr:UDP-glucose--hexose-1-phosphate uridylyltransferase [Clostridium sp.]MCM1399486.1 UDP-glucose--hexose-1-phosphate uridylyltransferase [Clostridium sp.]MCM1460040.1 UDP-glucose--hexose-1-phosphate uridylyltransferase [Bacteroides sp.]
MINTYIKQLVRYGLENGLLKQEDEIYTTNMLLAKLKLDDYEEQKEVTAIKSPEDLECTLKGILDYAVSKGIIKEDSIVLRDLFDTEIMNTLMARPSEIIKSFWEKYESSPKAATDYYYNLSKASDYIRTYRVKKDKRWVAHTPYGDMDITINLSKPEKDPKMIALAKNAKVSAYPKCQLCVENEGYAGRINHPARQNHRIIPIEINKNKWGFQYSPYVYYNEHCIVFNGKHVPMKIERDTFVKLFDFIDLFPHYFVGSNADLPIVGGSILSHDHFQGGNYTFAMAKAPIEQQVKFSGFGDIDAGIVKWPMSVIRLTGADREQVITLADKILNAWRAYSDKALDVFAKTDGEPHNTITPIARMWEGKYQLDLVLRNNITTKEHPLGLFHPWEEYHNIKKENIGLIEVMGLAVLPSRLKMEMETLAEAIVNKTDIRADEDIAKHANWVDTFRDKYDNIEKQNVMDILESEIGTVFQKVLECAGVYKRNKEGKDGFLRFIDYVNQYNA